MLPVSGAEQLNTSELNATLPIAFGAERVLQIGQPSALVLRRIVGRGRKKQIPQAFGLRGLLQFFEDGDNPLAFLRRDIHLLGVP